MEKIIKAIFWLKNETDFFGARPLKWKCKKSDGRELSANRNVSEKVTKISQKLPKNYPH
jgi:hypothetical protein